MTACILEPLCVHGWAHTALTIVAFVLIAIAVLILAFPVRRSFQDDWRRRRGKP